MAYQTGSQILFMFMRSAVFLPSNSNKLTSNIYTLYRIFPTPHRDEDFSHYVYLYVPIALYIYFCVIILTIPLQYPSQLLPVFVNPLRLQYFALDFAPPSSLSDAISPHGSDSGAFIIFSRPLISHTQWPELLLNLFSFALLYLHYYIKQIQYRVT